MEALSVANTEWFMKSETQAIFACLNRGGFEARVAGGAVRNGLLGCPVTEVDFATTAKPADIVRLAEGAGIKTVPTGISHGTVTMIVNKEAFEVTSLRRDIATDGRHAVVAFGEDWTEDAKRRDFTINALFADASGKVHDPLGQGIADLRARRVRFIGAPEARIREDYLRILRFFRFSATYAQGDFDPEGVAASIREREGLFRLSRERVRSELFRILVAPRAKEAVCIMDESGILARLLGGVVLRRRFERFRDLEADLHFEPDPIFRLAALACFIEEDAARLADRLRLSGAEAAELSALAGRTPAVSAALDSSALEEALYRLGPRLFLGRLLLAWAWDGAPATDPAWRAGLVLLDGWVRPKFPLTGSDLIERGWKPGPELGNKLKALEDYWIKGGFKASREALLSLADAA